MKCAELARALRHVTRLDDRLGVILMHRSTCPDCADDAHLEELVARMVAARHAVQLERRRLGV